MRAIGRSEAMADPVRKQRCVVTGARLWFGTTATFTMRIGVICLLLCISSVWASAGTLQGTVKDSSGHPIKGAEVRIEAKIGKFTKIAKTDAAGHYSADGLAASADYKVTLFVNGSAKASTPNVRANAAKPTDLNFDLRQVKGSSKRHMVYVKQETGTHIGSGRWIVVDENGQVVNDNQDMQKAGSNYAKQLENSKANVPTGP